MPASGHPACSWTEPHAWMLLWLWEQDAVYDTSDFSKTRNVYQIAEYLARRGPREIKRLFWYLLKVKAGSRRGNREFPGRRHGLTPSWRATTWAPPMNSLLRSVGKICSLRCRRKFDLCVLKLYLELWARRIFIWVHLSTYLANGSRNERA